METFNPLGDVGETLRSILHEGMGTLEVSDEQIALASPEQFEPDEVGLSVHLYHLREDAHLANERDLGPLSGESARPLVLQLYYLITAHPPNGETVETGDTISQHQILSKAVRTLHEHSIVSGSRLSGDFPPETELHITIDADATDHVMDVWGSFQDTPYLPSVSYVVSPVVIETAAGETDEPVTEATMHHFGSTR